MQQACDGEAIARSAHAGQAACVSRSIAKLGGLPKCRGEGFLECRTT